MGGGENDATRSPSQRRAARCHTTPLVQATAYAPPQRPPRATSGGDPAQQRWPTLAPASVARAGTLGPFPNTHTRARAHTQACSTPTSRLNGPPPLRHTLVGGRVWETDTPASPSRASSLAPLTPSHLLSTGALNPSFPRHPTPGTHPTSTLKHTHSWYRLLPRPARPPARGARVSPEGLGNQRSRCWGLSTLYPDPQDPTSSARGKVNPDLFFPLEAESNTPTPVVLAPPKPLLAFTHGPPGDRALAAPGVGEGWPQRAVQQRQEHP